MRIHFTEAHTPLWIAQAALDECKRAGTIAGRIF